MIGERLTVKEMAARQCVSVSAVNKRISTLKSLFQVNTQRELFALSRALTGNELTQNCGLTESACTKKQLPEPAALAPSESQNDPASMSVLRDSMTFQVDAPWQVDADPQIVPRMLDGPHAVSARLIAILAATVLILVAIMVGLGVAQGVTQALRSHEAGPHTAST